MDDEDGRKTIERIVVFAFGLVFVTAILVIAFKFPAPTRFQCGVFRIILAIASAGVAAFVPGSLNANLRTGIKAGGAIAVFVIVYFFNPASHFVDESDEKRIDQIANKIQALYDDPVGYSVRPLVESPDRNYKSLRQSIFLSTKIWKGDQEDLGKGLDQLHKRRFFKTRGYEAASEDSKILLAEVSDILWKRLEWLKQHVLPELESKGTEVTIVLDRIAWIDLNPDQVPTETFSSISEVREEVKLIQSALGVP